MVSQYRKNYFEKENNIRLANATNEVCLEIVPNYYATIIIKKRSLKNFVLWKHRVEKGGENFYGNRIKN